MQFIDLKRQQQEIRLEIDKRIHAVLDHGKYILGPEVAELENALKKYVDVPYAIACSSGTDALLLALMAYGIGPNDAVFTTPFTFFATAEVISLLGATPVFVDIDPDTMNISPELLERAISKLVSKKSELTPKAVIAVDLFGLTADYDSIGKIAKKYNIRVIEDAAQSFGAEYLGKKACSFGDVGCTSFFPAKPLGGYGDSGMCFTTDKQLADEIRCRVVHGQGSNKYDNVRIGINGRLDTIQAAILLEKFRIFPNEVCLRQQVAKRYVEMLQSLPIRLQTIPQGYQSVWAQFSILAKSTADRNSYIDILKTQDIPTAIYYPKPLHLQPAMKYLGNVSGDFPVSEDYANRIFSIPMHPYLTQEDQQRIVDVMKKGS